jgi:tryptophan 2,3-dioxygenase
MPDASLSPNDAWWDFAVDPSVRDDERAGRLTDADGQPLVNPPDAEGRLGLDYTDYLGLDWLLDAQTPSSRVPDERAFIIVHQLFELVFKQMTFDLGVLARTFRALLDAADEAFEEMTQEPLPDERGPSPFWRPAFTAAARVRYSARRVLPTVMQYVGRGEDDDVLFSTLEYQRFRDFLAPASGFQTAQLRLIQRAFGKSPLLDVRVFPGDTYGEHYTGSPCGHIALGDPLILRSGHPRAFPPEDHPARDVARLDDLAHAVLARLAPLADDLAPPPTVRRIRSDEVERAVARVRATLGDTPDADAIAETFRRDLEQAALAENERREGFDAARHGAHALHSHLGRTALAFVLDRIAATDAALHDTGSDSFLTVHRKAVRRHVADEGGTGGGGMPYLVTSQRFLLPLFPALVAYTDLGVAGTAEGADRW